MASLPLMHPRAIGVLFALYAAVVLSLLVLSFLYLNGVLAGGRETRTLLDVALEANLWTWLNVITLFCAGAVHLLHAADRGGRARLGWSAAGLAMVSLSIDDGAKMHERFLTQIGKAMGAGEGVFHFHWVMPGLIVGAVICLVFAAHLRDLRGASRAYLVLGVLLFFGGALGGEMITGASLNEHGRTPFYVWGYHVEEGLEAAGAVLLLASGLAADTKGRLKAYAAG